MDERLVFDMPLMARIFTLLEGVPDPEIPVVSVVDLGIVRSIETAAEPCVTITPTYTGCPATQAIHASVRSALDADDLAYVAIRTVLSPAWSTDMISDAGREKLRAYGIAPPCRNAAVRCPQCQSANTHEVSRFGSTPCKALWQCDNCAEPFDSFKCH